MKSWLILFLFVVAMVPADAEGKVSGHVEYVVGGGGVAPPGRTPAPRVPTPAGHAYVIFSSVKGKKVTTTADSEGNFSLSLPAGHYRVRTSGGAHDDLYQIPSVICTGPGQPAKTQEGGDSVTIVNGKTLALTVRIILVTP